MLPSPMFDCLPFDVGPLAQEIGDPAEVGIGRCHVAPIIVLAGLFIALEHMLICP